MAKVVEVRDVYKLYRVGDEIVRALDGLDSVSYTHLDVYKRQVEGCYIDEKIVDSSELKLREHSELLQGMTPVSYTHLEDYRRLSEYRGGGRRTGSAGCTESRRG